MEPSLPSHPTTQVAAFLLGCLLCLLPLQAQSTGTIQGRVYNPATGQYVRNAEVRLEGTNQVTTTENDGSFQFNYVPAGPATITVSYTGHDSATERLTITAGQTATREVNLQSLRGAPTKPGTEIVRLQAYTVSTEREGNAKAIMEQKNNMNITTSVASDIFGDVTDGSVGEFMKYLPGIDINYSDSETRGPMLGGMDMQYTAVAFDGVRIASADMNRTGDLGRATSFEAFAISSVEAIEIFRTTSPDMDADSPAGSINLRTRRAFDRKGRRVSYNFSYNLNSEEFTWSNTFGPSARKEAKARPNYGLEYSDVFANQRFGFVASVNHVNSYTEAYRQNLTYNLSPTAADPRQMVTTVLDFRDGNKNIGRDTYSLTMDWKATPRLVLSATYVYNYAVGISYNRNLTFTAAANNSNGNTGRQTVLGDGVDTVRTNGLAANSSRTSAVGGTSAAKITGTVTIVPKFEYKIGSWTIEGIAALSRSRNNYEAVERGLTRTDDINNLTSDFTATRSGRNSAEWTIQQTSGPDWFNLANRTDPRLTNEGRFAETELWSGELSGRWVLPLERFPTSIKLGGKWAEESRHNRNETAYDTWRYIGPGGGSTGSWAFLGANPNFWSTGRTNILTLKDLNGQYRPESIPRPDSNAIADLFNQHPELFTNIASADNYYNAFIANRRDLVQTVQATYGMADIRLTRSLAVRTGLRWEKTENDAMEFNPRSKAEMQAAGFPLNTAGRATTIPGYQYQYQSKPRITRHEQYDNLFPMISAKYNFTPDLQFQAGANKAISRPPPDSLTGAWVINEDTHIITSPNPNLLPERSNNYTARLSYYLNRSSGAISIGVAQHDIRNLRATRRGTAAEFGLADDPEYANYDFQAPFNVDSPVRFRSWDLDYRQTLPFQSEFLRRFTVTAAYTHTYANERRGNLLPHRVATTLSYGYQRLRLRVSSVWRDNTPEDIYGRYRRHDMKFDVGGEYRLNKYVSLFFQGRNILNDDTTSMETPAGNVEGQAAAMRVYDIYGANWNFGIKGTF